MKKILLAVVTLLVVSGFVLRVKANKHELKHTYFAYSASEIADLNKQTSNTDINLEDIYLWNQKVFRVVSSNKVGDVDASRIYAYLAVAQRDFAVLSHNATGSYKGSISVVSEKLLCTFFKSDCEILSIDEKTDDLSSKISDLVMKKVTERIAKDAAVTKPFVPRAGKDLWQGEQPSVGIDAMNRLPWYLDAGNQFRVAPPPDINSNDYEKMLETVKEALSNITEEQRAAVVFWAGGPGTKTPPGIWLNIADQYMKDVDSDLNTVLNLHADITTAMADAVIAVFDSKYTYQQKRPFMLDSTINTVMPTPNHPSYPAGHATISGAAHTILEYYFPNKKAVWLKTANEASDTRVWGGIHFPIDNTVGLELGEKVGAKALEHDK